MTHKTRTIEDYLEIIVGLSSETVPIDVNSNDNAILSSLARQVFRQTALTDRQHSLAKEKLIKYQSQFEQQGFENFDIELENLRIPLRVIDRSKTITIEDNTLQVTELHPHSSIREWIKVRFPFNKKTIVTVDVLANKHKKYYHHVKGTHEHFFALTENTAHDIVEHFVDRNFQIDQEIIDLASSVKQIKDNAREHLPCIFEGQTHNLRDIVINQINTEVGNSVERLIDRHRRYGLINFDTVPGNSLKTSIINRDDTEVSIKPSEHSLSAVFETIKSLDRFPLLVVLNERTAEDEIFSIWESTRTFIDTAIQSVLFRQEGTSEFNQFVKNKSLNNWVDTDTKIVYISSSKLPKLLLSGEWKPITTLNFSTNLNRHLDTYIKTTCDLVINYNDEESLFKKHSRYYSW